LPAVIYPNLLCLFLCIIAIGMGFARMYRKKQLLEQIGQAAVFDFSALPTPDGEVENMYQTLLRTLQNTCDTQANQTAKRYADMMDYYTLWAHQIKTPIAAMRLLLQDADTDEQRALLEQLQSVEQYVEMVLGYLRLESPSSDYVIRNYALDDIVRQAVRKFASQFIRRKLRLEYAPLNVSVITDEKWLLFVIEQVLSNALKYTRSGSVSITLEAPKTLCIRDTGIGIAPEDLPRVFEKGYTGCNGRTDKRATGIGLYLCRRILEKLGHTIAIASTPGAGTTVRIGLAQDALEVE
jgi:signal transduction histidine kinase